MKFKPQLAADAPRTRSVLDSNTRWLIINADDFGLSASTNGAIIRAYREGILTAASLMVNETGFQEAVQLARGTPRLGVGLHLTLVDGHATLDAHEIPGLVNERGKFETSPARAGWKYFMDDSLRPQLEAEIFAQFEKFQSTGLPLDHVNSHHHLHAHPTLLQILIENAERLAISHLRLVCEPLRVHARAAGWRCLRNASHGIVHCWLARRARPLLREAGIRSPAVIFGLRQSGRMDGRYLERLLPALPTGVSEIYFHPSLDRLRQETEALVSPKIRALIEELGIIRIRYQDI
jgi:hopanoid biosynthesis associated protein HpnK